jgi:hypothetical protein
VTPFEVGELVEQYRAGIEAELSLLTQLADIADRQRQATAAGDLSVFHQVADDRDALMRNLVTIEEGLRTIRATLGEHRDMVARIPAYAELALRHQDASHVIARILATDRQSMAALADAELARRSALASLERGESTLAAYRRVLAPPLEHAKLVDKVG